MARIVLRPRPRGSIVTGAHVLSLDHSPKGIVVAIGLFMPVGWVWAGHTVYATRFDTDDLVYRLLTFLQMFAVMGMAVEVAHAAHGEGRGFGISYLGARIILLILLARAFYHVREARFSNGIYGNDGLPTVSLFPPARICR
jgi:low temperature requirement protein LtrA